MGWLRGRPFALPPDIAAALAEIFGDEAAQVRIFERSFYARLHGACAVTRPGRIHVAGSGDELCRRPELLLHEYCHVLHQWHTGELTRLGYLAELLRRGYWHNRYEIAARDFAQRELGRLQVALRRRGRALG